MKLLCITLLTSLSLTAQIVDPAETPTVAFNLADLKFGAVPPVLHDGILSFSSNETQSSSAQLPQAISLEKGLFSQRADFFEEVFGIKPVIKQKKR